MKDKCKTIVYTFVNGDIQWLTHQRFLSNYADMIESIFVK